MQARGGAPRPPIGVAFEGDLGTRIDAVLAVAMLQGFVGKGEARAVALAVSKPSIKSAQVADAIGGFYSPRPAGGSLMIGMPEGASATADAPPLAALLAKRGADGSQPHTSNIATTLDTADNAVLIRNIILAQNDGNAAIVVAGPATGMAKLLGLFGARPQVATKVKHLVLAIGAFGPGAAAEASVKSDIASARKLFAEWPTPIIVAGAEIGAALPYPAASIEKDFGWAPVHPVVDAYRIAGTMPYDAPAPALAAVTYAVHDTDGYFTLSEPGTISVTDDGRTTFTAGAGGKHRYLIADPAQKDRVTKLYTAMVSATPPPRPGRGGRGAPPAAAQQQQQQIQPPQQQQQAPPQQRPAPTAPATPPPARPATP
jgi:hypothetical protein